MIGKRQMKKTLYLGLFFIMMSMWMSLTISAQESSVHLNIDNLNLEVGVSTTLTLYVENMNGGKVKSIEGLEKFDVLSSGQSSSTRIINGDTSHQIQLNYTLMPKAIGDYQLIGHVEYEGKMYKTNVLEVHVVEQKEKLEGESNDLFVKTIISKDSAYFGEKIVLTYELYSRYNIEDYGFTDEVKLDGFITKDLSNEQLKANYITIDGNKYVKYEVKKTILSPTSSGLLKIPSYNFQVNLSTGDFFSPSKPMYLKTNEQEILVKQLPIDQQPSNFTGLVGQLEVKAKYSRDEVDFGQSLSLQVTLSGNSNLELLEEISPKVEGFTTYETEKDLKEDIMGNAYFAQKEFEIILVPQSTGEINIKPICINYFDVDTNMYKEVVIPGKTINVKGEMPKTPSEGVSSGERTESKVEQVIINQVNPNQIDDTYFKIKKRHVYVALFVIGLIVVVLGIMFLISKKRLKQNNDLHNIYIRMKKANDNKAYYDILNEMIKYRYYISLKATSRYEIEKHIDNQTVVNHIFEIMDYFETGFRQEEKRAINLKEIIKKIYKEIKVIK